jgi:hypothetical protein
VKRRLSATTALALNDEFSEAKAKSSRRGRLVQPGSPPMGEFFGFYSMPADAWLQS